MTQMSHQQTVGMIQRDAQAKNAASAGLVDTLAWFRNQTLQPVNRMNAGATYNDGAFFPRYDTDPTKSATIDESIGLVKEFQLETGDLWARYEVKRQPSVGDFNPLAIHDVTDRRIYGGVAGDGVCWSATSVGYVYARRDPAIPFNQAPNQVLGQFQVSGEIQRLLIKLPTEAAVIKRSIDNITLNRIGRIIGPSAGTAVAYYTGSSAINLVSPTTADTLNNTNPAGILSSVTGATVQLADEPVRPEFVFGVGQQDLKLFADVVISRGSPLPTEFPQDAVVVIDGDATFDRTHRLQGFGVLFVNGDLTIEAGAECVYSGLIYTRGSLIINAPTQFQGAVVVEGDTLYLSGGGALAQITYDSSVLQHIRTSLARYRLIKERHSV